MTKLEFLHDLEKALRGQLSAEQVAENIRYYDSYVEEQKASGQTEEEVLEQRGDPGLIARSILDAAGAGESGETIYGQEEPPIGAGTYRSESGQGRRDWNLDIDLSKWYWKLAAAAVVIVLAVLVLTIVFGILKLLFYIAVPVIAVLAIVALIEYIRDRRQ